MTDHFQKLPIPFILKATVSLLQSLYIIENCNTIGKCLLFFGRDGDDFEVKEALNFFYGLQKILTALNSPLFTQL